MKFQESTFSTGSREVKYVLEEAKYNKDYLIVVFSGFAPITAKSPYRYNYIRTLRQIDANKLFILDKEGPRGSYYLGKAMTFDFEKDVIALIEAMMKKLNIDHQHVIMGGTSKGGSAALYYALKYKMGRAIVGAPQTKIANYILSIKIENEGTAEYILGDRKNKANIQALNRLIYEQLETNNETRLSILSSEHDNQYSGHIIPFEEALKKIQRPYTLVLDNDIKNHNDVAKFYPAFLVNKLLKLMYGFTVEPIKYQFDENSYEIATKTEVPNDFTPAIHFYEEDNLLKELSFTTERKSFELHLSALKEIQVAYVIKKAGQVIYRNDVGEHLISDKNKLCTPKIEKVNDNKFYFDLNISSKQKLKYAFYIYHEGKIHEKIMYQRKQKMTYRADRPGKYLVKYFILLPNKEKIIGKFEQILI